MKTDLQKNNLPYFLNQLEELGVKIDREDLSQTNIEKQIVKLNKRNLLVKNGYTWTTVWQAPIVTLSNDGLDTINALDYYWNIYLGYLTVDLIPFIRVNLIQESQAESQNINFGSSSGYSFYIEDSGTEGIKKVTLNYSLYLINQTDAPVSPKNAKLIVYLANSI